MTDVLRGCAVGIQLRGPETELVHTPESAAPSVPSRSFNF